jgi:hypothetical protein
MESGQVLPLFDRASPRHRLFAGLVFLFILGGFTLGWLMEQFHFSPWPFACGFKQRYGLPCLTCGMTTAVKAFSHGHIIQAFYAQPAAVVFCFLAIVIAFFAFLIACLGLYFPRIERLILSIKIRYYIIAIALILVSGWVFTLTKTLIQQGRP